VRGVKQLENDKPWPLVSCESCDLTY